MRTRSTGAPKRIETIPRPRLLRLLGGRYKIAVFTAPAGYGKTTLARQLANAPNTIWHRVSPEDGDPAHLVAGLVRAGLRARPPAGKRTESFLAHRRDFERDGALLASTLADEVAPARGRRWIVLDDLHHLELGSESSQWLRRWIEASGPRVTFIFTCRGDAPLPLQRFELEGGVCRLGVLDLAFDEEEQRRFLGADHHARLRSPSLADAVRGWPAGLALFAVARGQPSPVRSTGGGDVNAIAMPPEHDRERLFAFLAEEVFEPLDADLRWALCRASLLESLEPESLRALLGEAAADELLLSLSRHDLFVDRTHDLLRFHPLFHAYLRDRFHRDPRAASVRRRIPGLAARLARRGAALGAIRLLGETGFAAEALQRFDEVAAASEIARSSTLSGLARWIETRANLPHASSAWFEFHAANDAAASRQYPAATARYWSAEALFAAKKLWLHAARVFHWEQLAALQSGRHLESLDQGRALLTHVPARERSARGILLLSLGALELHAGDPERARGSLKQAEALLRKSGLEVEATEAALRRATVDFTEGRWDLFLTEAQKALLFFRRAGYLGRTMALLINLAAACVYLGREDQALAHLDEARALLELERAPAMGALEAMVRFRALAEAGRLEEAAEQATLASAEISARGSPLAALEFSVWRGIFERRRGRLDEAERLLNQAVTEAERIDSPAWRTFARMEWALVRGLRGETGPALAILDSSARASRRLGDRKELARNLLYRARLRQLEGTSFENLFAQAFRILEREDHLVLLRKESGLLTPVFEALARGSGSRALRERWMATLPASLLASLVSPSLLSPSPPAPSGAASRSESIARASVRSKKQPSRIDVRLLGGFELSVDGRSIQLHRRTAEALIALLALRGGQAMSRDAIGEALWPGAPPTAIRNRLDVALSIARRALEPEAGSRGPYRILQGQSGLLRLDLARVELDLARFEDRARLARPWLRRLRGRDRLSSRELTSAQSSIASAIDAHAGDLLPDFLDQRWSESTRIELRESRRRLLLGSARCALLLGKPDEALPALLEVTNEDPLDEEGHRLLFRALAASGDRVGVLRRYRGFRKRLREELQTEPSPNTIGLVRSLLAPEATRA